MQVQILEQAKREMFLYAGREGTNQGAKLGYMGVKYTNNWAVLKSSPLYDCLFEAI